MADADKHALTNYCKRRGVVKATRLETRLSAMESANDEDTIDNAHQLLSNLGHAIRTSRIYTSMVHLIDDEETVSAEQTALDTHYDLIVLRIQKLIALLKPPPDSRIDNRKFLTHRLNQIQECLSAVNDALGALTGDAKDVHRLQLHEEQLGDSKKDISDVKMELM